jgi:hypothetical protein
MLRNAALLISAFALLFATSCKQLNKAVEELAAFKQCKFRVASVSNTSLMGINIQNMNSLREVNVTQVLNLTNGYLQKKLPLNFNLGVEIQNSAKSAAAMARFAWIMKIDGKQMLEGNMNSPVRVEAGQTSVIPMGISFNLFDVLKSESKDALLNFAFNLGGKGGTNPSRIQMLIKPTFKVGTQDYTYPSYLEVGTTFTGMQADKMAR